LIKQKKEKQNINSSFTKRTLTKQENYIFDENEDNSIDLIKNNVPAQENSFSENSIKQKNNGNENINDNKNINTNKSSDGNINEEIPSKLQIKKEEEETKEFKVEISKDLKSLNLENNQNDITINKENKEIDKNLVSENNLNFSAIDNNNLPILTSTIGKKEINHSKVNIEKEDINKNTLLIDPIKISPNKAIHESLSEIRSMKQQFISKDSIEKLIKCNNSENEKKSIKNTINTFNSSLKEKLKENKNLDYNHKVNSNENDLSIKKRKKTNKLFN